MDFTLLAIALGDVTWIAVAFGLGLVARTVGLPPLVGFLAAGFALNLWGVTSGDVLRKLADLGITLLLFTVGLKLSPRTFARPQVWAVTGLHMALVVGLFGPALSLLALLGPPLLSGLDLSRSLLIAFALSFSSTVFVVKVLEEKGETAALHGRIAVGILVVQDVVAVLFLAASVGQWPSPWALLVLLLLPVRPLLTRVLAWVGHGELLVLYALLLALGGAELFELVGLKGDVGALILGVLVASHEKADELAKTMLGFKDLFLLGFFLSIGLSGPLTLEAVLAGVALTPFVLVKAALFFGLFVGFKLRARTALFASLNLTNYSEFGLIVGAAGVAGGWLEAHWLIVFAIALALSFTLAAVLNDAAQRLYDRHRPTWTGLERTARLPDDQPLDIGGATIAIIGMGRLGTAAYDHLQPLHGGTVVGIDHDPDTVHRQRAAGRHVVLGDPGEADFWERVQTTHTLTLVLLALPHLTATHAVLAQITAAAFDGQIAAAVRFPDEGEALEQAGASIVFNVLAEAGAGFAADVAARTARRGPPQTGGERHPD